MGNLALTEADLAEEERRIEEDFAEGRAELGE